MELSEDIPSQAHMRPVLNLSIHKRMYLKNNPISKLDK